MTDENKAEEQGTDTGAGVAEQPANPPEGETAEHQHPPGEGHEHPEGEEEKKAPPKLEQQVDIRDVGPCKKHIKVSV